MLFPLTGLTILACLAWARKRDTPRSPLVLALSFWAASVVFVALPILSYQVGYSLGVDALVAASLLAATLGYLLVRHEPRRPTAAPARPAGQPAHNHHYRRKQVTVCLGVGVLGIIGCVMILIDTQISGTQISVASFLTNVANIRADTLESSGIARSGLFTVGFYLASCSYISVIATVHLGRAGGRPLVSIGLANFALLLGVSLFAFGGRTIVLNGVLTIIVSVYLSGKSFRWLSARTVVALATLTVTAWYFSTIYFDAREGTVNVDRYLAQLERAELRPWIAPAARSNEAVGNAVINFGYFASPLATLSWYMQRPSHPGPFWGSNSYPIATYVVSKTTGATAWVDVRQEVFAPLESAGYAGNVWATWLRDLVLDFGSLGAIVYCFTFGTFMAWARNRFILTGAVHYHVLEVIACATLGFGAFQNLLLVNILSGSFLVAVAVVCVTRARLEDFRETSRASTRGGSGKTARQP